MNQIIGTCGNCGGPVSIRDEISGLTAACGLCGSTPIQTFGPVLAMNKAPERVKNIGETMVEAFIRARIEEGNA